MRRVSYYYEFYYIEKIHAYVRLHDNNMTNESLQHTPLRNYIRYRKLTNDLLVWGKNKFTKEELRLVKNIEWKYVKKILINRNGIFKKVKFIIEIFKDNKKNGLYLIILILKNYRNYK